jgi:hypothetical protein
MGVLRHNDHIFDRVYLFTPEKNIKCNSISRIICSKYVFSNDANLKATAGVREGSVVQFRSLVRVYTLGCMQLNIFPIFPAVVDQSVLEQA